jgi:hypothetical protein
MGRAAQNKGYELCCAFINKQKQFTLLSQVGLSVTGQDQEDICLLISQ